MILQLYILFTFLVISISGMDSLAFPAVEMGLGGDQPRSTVGDLGERKVVERILKLLKPCPKEALPIGDDASALSLGNGLALVIKSDMLVASTDVPPGMSAAQVGKKVVAMNFSDLAAKGVSPTGFMLSLGLPRDFAIEDTLGIMRGVISESSRFGACVMGGDTGEANGLIVSGMAFGFIEESRIVKRSGAAIGDILAVTGPFGLTGAGLKLLLERMKSEPELKRRLIGAVYEPVPKVREGVALAASGCLSSAIDSSDGLAWSIHELSRFSNVGFLVEDIPIPEEVTRFANLNSLDPVDLALNGGEEYELLVTVKRELWDEAERTAKKAGGTLYRIGVAVEKPGVSLKTDKGESRAIQPKGYEHFRSNR
jgi:thiamine-monophosphate kinase